MKQLCIFLTIFLLSFTAFSQIKVGDNVDTISPASLLELESTDQGVLLPRLTAAQRDAQGSWTEGHVIYNTTDSCFQFFDGSIWDCMVGASETIEYNPPGMKIFGSCSSCEGTTNDTVMMGTQITLSEITAVLDTTVVKNALNQNKCFLVAQIADGSYPSGVNLDFLLPSPANYIGKTFLLFIEPNPNMIVPTSGHITVRATSIVGVIARLGHDNDLGFTTVSLPATTRTNPGIGLGHMSCLRGVQITAVTAEVWATCNFEVCKD